MDMRATIQQEVEKSLFTIEKILQDDLLLKTIENITQQCVNALQFNKKILFAGNGGSAADSQHLAAELVSRLCYDRPALAAIALTTDTSALTAIGNDYSFEQLFARQICAIGQEGDVFIAISTSGKSPNILAALRAAREKGILTIGFTGANGGFMSELCDFVLKAPSQETPKIQECHIVLGHIICAMIEEKIFGAKYNPDVVRQASCAV